MATGIYRVYSLKAQKGGVVEGVNPEGTRFSASLDLWIIRRAWDEGLNLEALADGYGPGLGTMGGDWSGIRDSSDEARLKMLGAAMTFLERPRFTRNLDKTGTKDIAHGKIVSA